MELMTENGPIAYVSDIVFSYKKNPGWYPHWLDGTWTRLNSAIKVWQTREDAEEACPPGYRVQKLYLTFTEKD